MIELRGDPGLWILVAGTTAIVLTFVGSWLADRVLALENRMRRNCR